MKASNLKMKLGTWQGLAVILITLLTSNIVAEQLAVHTTRVLKFGKSVERKIRSGELHEYKLALRQGQVLSVDLDEQSFDAKLELVRDADKKSVATMNVGAGFERETLTFAADADGNYLLRVSDAEERSESGGYRLTARLADSVSAKDVMRIEAEKLLREAALSQQENRPDKIREAINKREQALTLWRRLGDRYWESHTLNRLGWAHKELYENNRAVEYLNQSLQIVKELGDKKIEANSLNWLGLAMNSFGQYQTAIEYHDQALRLFLSAKNNLGTANSLMYLGTSHTGLKDYVKANGLLQQSLTAARKEQNKNYEATALYLIGTVLEKQGEKLKALAQYNEALMLWRATKHDGNIALALLKIGGILTAQGDTNKALECLNEALKLFKAEKNRDQEAFTYITLSRLHDRLGKHKERIEFLQQSLARFQEVKINIMEISIAGLLASVYHGVGNHEAAIKYAEMVLATEERVPEKTPEEGKKSFEEGMNEAKAMALYTLGSAYDDLRDSDKALRYSYQALAAFEKKNDKFSRHYALITLNLIAQIYRSKYEWDQALESYQRALSVAKQLDDKTGVARAINSIGIIYGSTGDKRKALKSYEEALAMMRSVANKDDSLKRIEASMMGNVGSTYLFLGEPETALKYFTEALTVWQEIKDPSFIDGQSSAYHSIALVYSFQGQNEKALNLLNKSLDLFRQAPPHTKALARNRTAEARILDRIASIYKNTGNLREALKLYEQALKMAQEAGDLELVTSALNNISLVNVAFGEPQKALQNLNQALALNKRVGDRASEPTILGNIAQVHSFWGNRQEVLKYTQQALAAAEEIGDKSGIAAHLNNIGNTYRSLSENEKALNYFNRSLKIVEDLGDKSGQTVTLNNLAFLYSSTGERGKALDTYERALSIARNIGDKNNEATILGNMGFDYMELGEYQKAMENRLKGLQAGRESGDKLEEISQLFGIGNVYRKMGEQEKNPEHFKQALARYEQALKLSRETESIDGETGSLIGVGQVYIELDEPAKALPVLTEALDKSKKHQNKLYESVIRVALGKLHEKNGAPGEAVEEYQRGLAVARAIGDKDTEAKLLKGLMSAWKARGSAQAAIFYGKQAVNTYQDLRGSIRNLKRETQDIFRDKVTDAYRDLAGLLIEHGRFAEAEQVLGMLKEAEFRQLTRQSGGNPDTVPYSKAEADAITLVENLAALTNEMNELEKEKAEKNSLPADKDKRLEQVRQKEFPKASEAFFTALNNLTASEASVTDQIERIHKERSLQGVLGTLRRDLSTGVAALYTVIGTEEIKDKRAGAVKKRPKFGWMVLVTPEWRKAYPIDVSELEQTVFDFRAALSTDKYDPSPLAQKLYDKLFRQTSARQKQTLEQDLETYFGKYKDKTLMWSLDGVLRYIPMAALHDGKGYLVEKYHHVVFTAASRRFTDKDAAKWKVLGMGVSEEITLGNQRFEALKGAERELRDIVRDANESTGIMEGTRKLDKDFSKNIALRLWREGSFPVVHIASHYSFNPSDHTASFLLIGDGKLTFEELKYHDNLFDQVDLLTLSACDTAMGSADGAESEGFAVLGQNLGAKSVIASLWKVSDEGTPELMVRFYKWRAEHPDMSKGEAFRRAQLSLLSVAAKPVMKQAADIPRADLLGKTPRSLSLPLFVRDTKRPLAHPYYWASFVLIGNWK